MTDALTRIPFTLNGEPGVVEVCYQANASPNQSGFDLFEKLGFDPQMCIGYPTMHAYFREYAGSGYYTASAWIQVITDRFFDSMGETEPTKVVREVDVHPDMHKLGVPFFAFGYAPAIYDAPCNNLGDCVLLEWIADTFLVTHPSRINGDTISPLLAFRWGYREWNAGGKRQVQVLPLRVKPISLWDRHREMLQRDFPSWKFSDSVSNLSAS